MPRTKNQASAPQIELLRQIRQLAQAAIYGSLLRPTAGVEIQVAVAIMAAQSNGPHLYISYRGENGKTTGYYVPHHAEGQIRQGVEA